MNNASVIRLEDHRISRRPAALAAPESPVAAALAAPDYAAPDFGAAVPSEAEADARRASWHYPPATPIIDWFPPARTIRGRADLILEGLRLIAIAGCAAIVVGSLFATVAGAFAVVVAIGG